MATKINIEVRHEARRGCGYRKQGGLYMVSGKMGVPVPCLPVPLHVCPTCNQGVKPSRSFQWIKPGLLFPDLANCKDCSPDKYSVIPERDQYCPMGGALEADRAGLLWVGEKYYSIDSFTKEAAQMGVSRRLSAVPKDFKIGEHWVFLAHRKAVKAFGVPGHDPKKDVYTPGVFSIFKPTAIEYVVKPKDTKKKLKSLQKRGITLVDVIPIKDQQELDV
jgi:hypothetical protein